MMLKYTEVQVGFSEVPEEITLCINISGCPVHCKGCHSPHLWNDIGEELKPVVLSDLIARSPGVTCIAFMGGDANPQEIVNLARWVKSNTKLKTCWYSGRQLINPFVLVYDWFDYVKTGPYEEDKGGLNSPTTNQRFYKIRHEIKKGVPLNMFDDITFKFRNNEANNKSKSAN